MNDKLLDVAKKIIDESLEIKSYEKVCLVTDNDNDIVDAFRESLINSEIEYEELMITDKRNPSSSIPEAREYFDKCDVIIAPTLKSITHSQETTEAKKNNKRGVTLPGITEEIFLKILEADIKKVDGLNQELNGLLKGSKKIRVTTENGTDVFFSVKGRKWVLDNFKKENKDIGNLPSGEVFIAPVEDSMNGIIVIDYYEKIKPRDKATLNVKNGKIVKWNENAEKYIEGLKNGGENGLIIGEFGIGTNYSHKKFVGNILHDEKIYGSCHIAFGMNTGFGGKNIANVHQDVILMNPKIIVDGKELKY